MARVNVEQKALVDPRFRALGRSVGAKPAFAQATGIGLMTYVWNACQELERLELTPDEINDACGIDGIADKICAANLGERRTDEYGPGIRIRGAKGRTEWLGNARQNGDKYGHLGAEHGKKGGRPRKEKTPQALPAKPESGVSENPPPGLDENPPLSPAPSLAPTKIKTKEDIFSDVGVSKARSPAHTGISRGQYLYLADQVGKWSKEVGGLGPWSAEEWDRQFLRRFGMTRAAYDELVQQFSGPSSPQETSE